jgi:hypothetical protein
MEVSDSTAIPREIAVNRQREQRSKARIVMEGFLATGTRAEMKPRAGEAEDEVHVQVEGVDAPIRLLPRGGIILPPELDHVGPGILLDLAAR